jgi:hypothetical protein
MPPLSLRRPFRSAEFLLRDRRWLTVFAAETAGWLVYVAALRLAALALEQAVAASGVAVLAFATRAGTRPGSRGARSSPSSWRRRGAAHRHTYTLRPRRIARPGRRVGWDVPVTDTLVGRE